jgi:hypothetical protein
LAILSTTQNNTNLEVINAETMGQISQFEVFSRVAADSIVEVADLDNDGFMEIVSTCKPAVNVACGISTHGEDC